jgi:ketosteroid isomerase-like protein
MSRRLITAVLVPLLTLTTLAADSDTEKQIVALEHQWAKAQKEANVADVESLLSSDFVNTDVAGHVYGKDQLLSNLKGGRWEHNAISDVKVRTYGNVAVATGAWSGRGVDGDGTKIDRRERWTDTWIRTPDGTWRCVASHQTTVAP